MLNSNNGGGTTSIFDNVLVTVDGGTPLVPTATTVVSSNYTTTFGDPVTFTATIIPDPDSGAFPAGNVQFKLDGTNLELVEVTQVGSTSHGTAATTSITTIPVGSAHVVTAEYIPATGFLTSTGTLSPNQTVLVPAGTTTTTVASSQNPSAFGGPVTFTATIVPYPDSGAFPAGNVQFKLDGTNLELVPVTAGVPTSHGIAATTSITTIPTGSAHVVTAEYLPAAGSGFFTSTGTLSPNQIVLPAGQAIIISDTFTRADALLNGSAPEVGTGTWNSVGSDASSIVGGAVQTTNGSAYIPIGAVTSGHIYTASVDATQGGSWYWLGLAFSTANTSPNFPDTGLWGMRSNGGTVQVFNPDYVGYDIAGPDPTTHNFKIVLDTTNPTWSQTFFIDGTSVYTQSGMTPFAVNYVALNSNGVNTFDNVLVTVEGGAVSNPYDTWAGDYAGGGTPSEDFNHDGVSNGVAYFMGMNGLATNPGVVGGKVTWDHVNTVASFEVQVSDNLTTWVPADPGDVDVTTDPTKVVYTLPTGAAKTFCRLVVTP